MKRLTALCVFFLCVHVCSAQLRLPGLIGDSMVLQRSTLVPLWGWASPGETVLIQGSWNATARASAVAGSDGKWIGRIRTPGAGGPYTVTIRAKETVTLKGVMIGEVWLCSGQSNMEMPVQGWPGAPLRNAKQELDSASYPSIRLFQVRNAVAYQPADTLTGNWSACDSASVSNFSAVAYFFGRELYRRLHVPVGLIDATWGGTVAEAWTSRASLKTMGDFDSAMRKMDVMATKETEGKRTDSANDAAWVQTIPLHDSSFASPAAVITDWKPMAVPGPWEDAGLPNFDGIVWFRKTVTIPAAWAGKALTLDLGPVDDFDVSFFNGKRVGGLMTGFNAAMPRSYTVPAELVTAGDAVIAVRVVDHGGSGGMLGKPAEMRLYPQGSTAADGLPLAGEWQYHIENAKPAHVVDDSPNQPSMLFNAMIHPLIPFGLRGALWYQGEANVGRAKQYTSLFPLMIRDWRTLWKQGDFPFYFVQIAPYNYGGDSTEAAALRDAQRRTLTLSPNTGMAVTLDIGDTANIHPADKQDVAHRLAAIALAKNYGQPGIAYAGPLYQSMTVNGSKVRVSFTHTEGGLRANGKAVSGFEVLGQDSVWKPATAVIAGNMVEAGSPAVSHPIGVRYAWTAASTATLFNGAGLPASSFSTEVLHDERR